MASEAPTDPLLRIIRHNLFAAIGALVMLAFVYAIAVRSGWVLVLIAIICGVVALLTSAWRQARAGRRARAVGLSCAANLGSAPFIVAIVPEVLTPLALVVVLQVVLATDFLSQRQFTVVVSSAFASLLATAIASRTDGARSLLERAPMLTVDVVVVVAVPAVASFVPLLVWQHRLRLAAQASELTRSRARLTTAADRERRRLERDLHDGAQQQIIAATVQLPTIKTLINQGRTDEATALAERVEQRLRGALDDLRQLARGLCPPVLASRGLPDAIDEATRTLVNPTVISLAPVPRLAPEVETAVYFCCLEALQNATKHSGVTATITVELEQRGSVVTFCVADDGFGFDKACARTGSGLVNMADRIGAVGGTLAIETRPGAGTRVVGQVPIVAAVSDHAGSVRAAG